MKEKVSSKKAGITANKSSATEEAIGVFRLASQKSIGLTAWPKAATKKPRLACGEGSSLLMQSVGPGNAMKAIIAAAASWLAWPASLKYIRLTQPKAAQLARGVSATAQRKRGQPSANGFSQLASPESW